MMPPTVARTSSGIRTRSSPATPSGSRCSEVRYLRGATVERTGYDTTDLTNKALLAAQQGNSPDVLIVDNPVISTLAEAGALTTTDDNKLDVSAMEKNLLGAARATARPTGCRSGRTPSPCTTTRTCSPPPASTPPPSPTGRH
ncbi:extracellular solute-binding protein [Micromonospora sp. M12]